MASPRAKATRQPAFGAAIPLARAAKLDRESLQAALGELASEAGARARVIGEAGGRRGVLGGLIPSATEFQCELAGVRLTIRVAAKPLCDASTLHGFINPLLWRGGVGRLTAHRAHVLVAEEEAAAAAAPASRDAMFDRATAVTLATAAVASLVDAEAAIWLPARNAVPIPTFGAEMERFIDGQAPLRFWLRWQILPPPVQQERELGQLSGEALNPGVATIGMTPFIGAELVAPPSVCDRDLMLDHVFALASAVIDENAELKSGDVYGKAGGVMVRLNLRQSGPYAARPYWELLPRPAPAAKGAADTAASPAEEREGGGQTPEPRLRLIVPGR